MKTFVALAFSALAALPAIAQEWLSGGAIDGQSQVHVSPNSDHEVSSSFALGPGGLSPYTFSEASVGLGNGVTFATFSSLSKAGAAALSPGYDMWAGLSAIGGLGGSLNNPYQNIGGLSDIGGKLAMDLGGGLSLSLLGDVTRDKSNQFYLGPRGNLNMSPGGTTSSSIGGGLSMDLGSGQSFSLSGIVTKSNVGGFGIGPCGGMAIGLCR